ncbi:MAG TPA: YetF domain-containing protein [Pedomonas sp.]|uniref:DUF421 domain-containing protein n=1 Tax=Pedomonas sp. TaxID=2976421 RepID=UPI002F41CE5F
MFDITMPLWELFVRATIIYLALIFLVRVIPKRKAGHISPNDMLTLIILGGMGTDAIMGGSSSVIEALLMVGLIIGWGYVFDAIEARSPLLQRVLRDRQTTLIDRGRFIRQNMRRELVTEEELMAVLRKEGVDDVSRVRSACLEADGEISVIIEDKPEER